MPVRVNHRLFPRGSECESKPEGDKREMSAKLTGDEFTVRFLRTMSTDRMVAQKPKCGHL